MSLVSRPVLSRVLRSLVMGLVLNTFAVPSAVGAEPGVGCFGAGPLLHQEWAQSPTVVDGGISLGSWKLALSPDHPEVITEAVMELVLLPGAATKGGIRAEVRMSFPDPKPFGLPFTFQSVRLEWQGALGRRSAVLDWSDACGSPGRSIFPRQAWTATLELPETEGLAALENLALDLYGSRN